MVNARQLAALLPESMRHDQQAVVQNSAAKKRGSIASFLEKGRPHKVRPKGTRLHSNAAHTHTATLKGLDGVQHCVHALFSTFVEDLASGACNPGLQENCDQAGGRSRPHKCLL